MSLSSSPCLESVLEFLPLVEMTRNASVNKEWKMAASASPLAFLDTVGLSISPSRLFQMIQQHSHSLVVVRVSLPENQINEFVCKILSLIPEKMKSLKQLVILPALRDGSVFLNLQALSEIDRFTPFSQSACGLESLVIGCNPSFPATRKLIQQAAPTLISLAFLNGCESLFSSESQLSDFLTQTLCIESLTCLHLGACNPVIDMDPVISQLLFRARSLGYIQWSGCGASIDMMKSLVESKRIRCAFEGIGFLSLLLGI